MHRTPSLRDGTAARLARMGDVMVSSSPSSPLINVSCSPPELCRFCCDRHVLQLSCLLLLTRDPLVCEEGLARVGGFPFGERFNSSRSASPTTTGVMHSKASASRLIIICRSYSSSSVSGPDDHRSSDSTGTRVSITSPGV
eukprot:754192-Prymnesium_polylepis.2